MDVRVCTVPRRRSSERDRPVLPLGAPIPVGGDRPERKCWRHGQDEVTRANQVLAGQRTEVQSGCLCLSTWEDLEEQRFGHWGVEVGKTEEGSCGALTGRGSWSCPTLKNTRTKLTLGLSLQPLRLCFACLEFPPQQFPRLGWFPAPPAFLEPRWSIIPARHKPVSL